MPVPSGALAHLDFFSGEFWDGTSTVVSDVINHPEWYVPGEGLVLRLDNEVNPGDVVTDIINDALTALLTLNWTIYVEYDDLGRESGYDGVILRVQNNDWTQFYGLAPEFIDGAKKVQAGDRDDNIGPEAFRSARSDAVITNIHRVAATRTDARIVVSADGNPVVVDDSMSLPISVTTASFGGFSGDILRDDITIRVLTVYPPMDDADLPGLSSGSSSVSEPEAASRATYGIDPATPQKALANERLVRAKWAAIDARNAMDERDRQIEIEKRQQEKKRRKEQAELQRLRQVQIRQWTQRLAWLNQQTVLDEEALRAAIAEAQANIIALSMEKTR